MVMKKFNFTERKDTRLNLVNWDKLGFGRFFADYMFVSYFRNGKWDDGAIVPYAPFEIEPAMMTLHYGQTIFEGLKAYANVNGGINLFRPNMNAKRLNNSAKKLVIPEFPEENFIEAIKEVVYYNREFVPKKRGESLYLRPVLFGCSNVLGVHPSEDYMLIIFASPVASYYEEGLNPVKIKVVDRYVRAVRGGLGSAKTAANYAASLLAGQEAKKEGFSQVLWLDGVHLSNIDEVGAMNIMFVLNGEIVTPSLETGTILNGVTRDSVIQLAKSMNINVSERIISVDEIFGGLKDGSLSEAFGTGTAATISPVGLLSYKGIDYILSDGKIGQLSQKMYDTLLGIQYGEIEDKFGWIIKID
jgi:branched-chain amino acid aminotransferase